MSQAGTGSKKWVGALFKETVLFKVTFASFKKIIKAKCIMLESYTCVFINHVKLERNMPHR